MSTFLTNPKMAPALAARIEASIRGRRAGQPGSRLAPRLVAVLRLGALVALVAGGISLVVDHRRGKQELEGARAALLETWRKGGASLTPDDRGAVARDAAWLARFSAAYEGDFVASELRAPGAFAALVASPAVYVRGPLDSFTTPEGTADAASRSVKDALLLCLLEPPASHVEKVVLTRVRVAYAGGAHAAQRTASVLRLHEAAVGLPFLEPPWAARVQAAREPGELAKLGRELERAPVEAAKQAAKAGLLLVALDEPGDGPGATELDGERAHWVRLGLVDVHAAKVLLRLRRRVDPSWISAATRTEYARGLDDCALALDVHESVSGASSLLTRSGK